MSKRLLVEQKHTKAGIEFIKEGLEEFGIEKKQTIKTMLLVEEVLVKLREHAKDPDENICIILNKRFGRVYVNLSLRGEKFQFIYGHTIEEVLDQENDDLQSAQEKEEKIIRDVLLKANEERLRYKNKNNMNLVEITVQKNPHAMVLHTMLALIAAIVIGVLMKVFVPSGVNEALNNTIFTSISTMFLNALKMIVGPVVFFSIACCISQFGDLKEAGRLGGKIMGFYLLTTVLAILTATGVFELLKPGNPELAAKLAGDAAAVSV